MKKRIATLLSAALLSAVVMMPHASQALSSKDIDKQLADIEKQAKTAEKKKQDAQKAIDTLKGQQQKEQQNLDQLQQDIQRQGKELDDLNNQVTDITIKLNDANRQLVDAEARVTERDKQLKSRVRLMYMNGTVSYFDVLFSSTSFSDFLDRFDNLTNVVGQDKTILEANKRDRNLIGEKKTEIEGDLINAKTLYAKAEQVKQSLLQQEKKKEVMIAGLKQKVDHNESISEEEDAAITALVAKKTVLFRQKADQKRKEDAAKNGQAGGSKPTAGAVSTPSGGKLGWPVPGHSTITSTFGYRNDPVYHTYRLHKGVDIGAPNGSTIVAAESGTVVLATWVRGYGNTVVIDHGDFQTWYGHIREGGIKVSEGDTVKRGDKIAEVGSTGDSTGNHLHFEVRIGDKPTDPMPYLTK